MDKFEKIIDIPACFITREISDCIARKIFDISNEKALLDYHQILINAANQLNLV